MIIEEVIMKNGVIQKSTPKEETRYVPLSEVMSNKPLPHNPNITRSKVLVIKNLSVTITQNYDEAIDFVIKTDPGILSDNKTIPELDITAREEIVLMRISQKLNLKAL